MNYKQIRQNIKQQYLLDDRPWVVTFSGGKDSTLVLQLVIEMLLELRKEKLDKKDVYVVMSDTFVEMPIIENYSKNIVKKIGEFAKKENLKLFTNVITPKIEESFWSLLIGKGYPSPNQWFRWCTDRLKIRPATAFLSNLVSKYDSIIMLLGVRSAESINRANSIESRDLNHRGLSMHDTISNAFVFSPIKDLSNEEVWSYLSNNPAPWGSHKEMMKLYDKGSGEGDCNIALHPDSPSCGKTRFGCWVCTVVEKDNSMKGMLQSGEEWMEPLDSFRDKLRVYRNDETKRNKRKRNNTRGVGPFLLEVRKEFLRELLEIETLINHTLIKDEEIKQIQKYWNLDGDIANSAIKIANSFNRNLEIIEINHIEKYLLDYKDEANLELFKRVYEIEKHRKNISNRYKISEEIKEVVLNYYRGEFNENS